MKALFRKEFGKLVPAESEAEEWLAKLKIGDDVFVEAKRPRNGKHHRKFWVLMEKVWENQEFYASKKEIATVFKLETGHYDILRTKEHGDVKLPKSISYAAMGQDEFEVFYDKALDFCVTKVIPGLDKAALAAEVEKFL